MSAYIADRNTVVYLVKSAEALKMHWNGANLYRAEDRELAAVAQNLWDENITAVLHRYPDCTKEDAPGPIGEDFEITLSDMRVTFGPLDVLRVLRVLGQYEYQACEHPAWDGANCYPRRFVEQLQDLCISHLLEKHNVQRGAPEPTSLRRVI